MEQEIKQKTIVDNEPKPWFTKKSIEFISNNMDNTYTVIEFGGGLSSIWWAKKSKFTLTVEANYEWAAKLLLEFSKYPEAFAKWQLKFVASDWNPTIDYPKNYWKKNYNILTEKLISDMSERYLSIDFDPNIIVIDGSIRPANIQKVNNYLESNTSVKMIVIDNMESLGKYTINMFNEFNQYNFVEDDLTLIPEHQNGKWCTSVWLRK
jgi:hypothetical protein